MRTTKQVGAKEVDDTEMVANTVWIGFFVEAQRLAELARARRADQWQTHRKGKIEPKGD